MNRASKIGVTICVLLGSVALTALDETFGGLRFTSRRANVVSEVGLCCLPLVCIVLLGFLPRTRARQWGFAGLVPLAALCLLTAFITVNEVMFPSKVRLLSSIQLGHSRISIYYGPRQFGGAVYVQQEVNLLPGLLWVKPIANQQGPNIKISVLDRHHVRCGYVADRNMVPAAKREAIWVF